MALRYLVRPKLMHSADSFGHAIISHIFREVCRMFPIIVDLKMLAPISIMGSKDTMQPK